MREQPELQHMIQDIAGDNPYQAVRSPWNEGMDLMLTAQGKDDWGRCSAEPMGRCRDLRTRIRE